MPIKKKTKAGAKPRSLTAAGESGRGQNAARRGPTAARGEPADFSLTAGAVGGGVGNTPHSSPSDKCLINTCIDYLSVTLPFRYFLGDANDASLRSALVLDEKEINREDGRGGYRDSFVLDEDTVLLSGGRKTADSGDNETSSLQLSGSGCRRFEERVAARHVGEASSAVDWAVRLAWEKLLKLLLDLGGRCSRIDLPTDDFSGLVPFDGLKDRLARRSYVSRLRSFREENSFPSDSEGIEDSPMLTWNSRHQGYTCYLGTNQSVMLCIYNKKAERLAKGIQVIVPSWIRYEVRYYHKNAQTALAWLLDSYQHGKPEDFIFGCLCGVLSLRDWNGKDKAHLLRAPVWPKWADFVDGKKPIAVFSQARLEQTVVSNALWLANDASKALARLIAFQPHYFLDFYLYLFNDGVSRFDDKDLAIVNNARRKIGLEPFSSNDDLVSSLSLEIPAAFGAVDAKVIELFSRASAKLGGGSVACDSPLLDLLSGKGGDAAK